MTRYLDFSRPMNCALVPQSRPTARILRVSVSSWFPPNETGGIFLSQKMKSRKLERATALLKLTGMIQTIDALEQDAIELLPDQRFELAQRILASVEPEEAAGIDDAWTSDIRERIRIYDSGEAKGIPGAEVFAEIDRRMVP